ncbi:OmpA family protein [Picosynechococcus sp. NKBG042902]|uniref:OmpA family protein n=1 Tax=Picosynechococcus sp. NKBG042902 TaxID=490193 RepID=UPI001378CB27|nr:OmpA family protein [Picosynechococcus sp. NKBG042902]
MGRTALLLGSGFGAIALGILVGHFMPRAAPKPPLFLRLWATNSAGIAKPTLNETIAELSAEDRAAIEQEIAGIQAQLDVLEARTQQLEAELDLGQQQVDLGDRLDNLTELLAADPSTFDSQATPAVTSQTPEPLKITLPNNALFSADGQLAADAAEILGAIAIDLQQQERQTITIRSYQVGDDATKATSLAQQQAQAVQTYLAEALPGDYRWLVVGYGEQAAADPPEDTTETSSQARLEISTQ